MNEEYLEGGACRNMHVGLLSSPVGVSLENVPQKLVNKVLKVSLTTRHWCWCRFPENCRIIAWLGGPRRAVCHMPSSTLPPLITIGRSNHLIPKLSVLAATLIWCKRQKGQESSRTQIICLKEANHVARHDGMCLQVQNTPKDHIVIVIHNWILTEYLLPYMVDYSSDRLKWWSSYRALKTIRPGIYWQISKRWSFPSVERNNV